MPSKIFMISIEGTGSKAVIKADNLLARNYPPIRSFPLTKKGCISMGKFIWSSGATHWMCSSSVDFPKESKPSFKWDVRHLLNQGWAEASYKARHGDTKAADRNILVMAQG